MTTSPSVAPVATTPLTEQTFASLGLNAHLMKALEHQKLTSPTPVQAQAIPAALAGQDVMACAPTGTGKTGAFVLPSLHRILSGPSKVTNGRGPRLLVLTPTRELAQQVLTAVRSFGGAASIRTGVIVGGVSYGPQEKLLREPLDVLVATPGRLIDHLQEGKVDFSRCEMVVLDEADKMLDMGFKKPVERILDKVVASRPDGTRPQTLLFSATFNATVEGFAKQALHQPQRVMLASARHETSQISQQAYRADDASHKHQLLTQLLQEAGEGQTIVFSATKHGADKLAAKLVQGGHASAALHGGMRQNARKRILELVHKKKVQVLVATDVAARGIDVKQLSQVINFDLPQVAEDYVHRIGRTGRAGESGKAISLIAPSDVPMLRDIEKLLGKKMELAQLPGLEPQLESSEFDRKGAAAPRSRQGQGGGRPGGGSRDGQGFGARRSFGGSSSDGSRGARGGFGDRPKFGSRDGGRDSGSSRDGGRAEGSSSRGSRPEGRSFGERSEGRSFGERSSARPDSRPDSRGGSFGRSDSRSEGRPAEGRREGGREGGRSFAKPAASGGQSRPAREGFAGRREDPNRREPRPEGRPRRDFS